MKRDSKLIKCVSCSQTTQQITRSINWAMKHTEEGKVRKTGSPWLKGNLNTHCGIVNFCILPNASCNGQPLTSFSITPCHDPLGLQPEPAACTLRASTQPVNFLLQLLGPGDRDIWQIKGGKQKKERKKEVVGYSGNQNQHVQFHLCDTNLKLQITNLHSNLWNSSYSGVWL